MSVAEAYLDETAKWLNCSDRSAVASKMADGDLVTGRYSTSAVDGKQRLETVNTQWHLSNQKLTLWLQGQSAKHLTPAAAAAAAAAGGGGSKVRYVASAQLASRRYMPSASEVVADYTGYGLEEPASELPRPSPLVRVNAAVLKLGLGKPAGSEAEQGPSADEVAAEARRRRREDEDAAAQAKANAARSKLSVFAAKEEAQGAGVAKSNNGFIIVFRNLPCLNRCS